MAALSALLPGCQSCSDERPTAGGAPAIETHRRETVQLQALPNSVTTLDLPAPRVRSFELLDPGERPRQPLRYDHGAGHGAGQRAGEDPGEHALTVTVRVDSRELVGDDWTPWGTLPELRYGLALGREAEQDVLVVRGLALTAGEPAAAAPEIAAYVKRVTDELSQRFRDQVQGRRATAIIDARGRIEALEPMADAQPRPGAHTRHEMLQILAESLVPLPEEPVGVGARWRVTMLMRRGAGMVNQVGTYELVAVEQGGRGGQDEPTWRIRATIHQDGEHQAVTAPELPSNVSAELLALLWRAHGELVVSPRSLTPRSGQLDIDYRVHSRLGSGGIQMDLLLESKGTIELATAAP